MDRLLPPTLRYAARILADRAEAEDVAQEAMLRLWRIAPDWRNGEAQPRTWLYRVVTNLCNDRLRARKRRSVVPIDEVAEPLDPAAGVLAEIIEDERMAALTLALQCLPERQRQAVILRHIEGLTNPEIAAILEIGVEAVESLTAQAIGKIRQRARPPDFRDFRPCRPGPSDREKRRPQPGHDQPQRGVIGPIGLLIAVRIGLTAQAIGKIDALFRIHPDQKIAQSALAQRHIGGNARAMRRKSRVQRRRIKGLGQQGRRNRIHLGAHLPKKIAKPWGLFQQAIAQRATVSGGKRPGKGSKGHIAPHAVRAMPAAIQRHAQNKARNGQICGQRQAKDQPQVARGFRLRFRVGSGLGGQIGHRHSSENKVSIPGIRSICSELGAPSKRSLRPGRLSGCR